MSDSERQRECVGGWMGEWRGSWKREKVCGGRVSAEDLEGRC